MALVLSLEEACKYIFCVAKHIAMHMYLIISGIMIINMHTYIANNHNIKLSQTHMHACMCVTLQIV